MKNNTNKGITLIALIITIIVMLILISVTINMAINGGLFDYAKKAKDSTEIASEKETIAKASILAEGTSKTGRVTVEEMQKAINSITDENKLTAMDNGDAIVVKFNDSNRYYEVDSKGKIEGPKELVKDDYAGDITKGGACDGSKEKPFQISCIEDLVAFSIMTNGGNKILGLSSNKFIDQYVELTRTLDFKSMFSYSDYTTIIYGDLNTDGKIEDIKTELTKTDEGCIGFKGMRDFQGKFDGQDNEIRNIYINTTTNNSYAGLFVSIKNAIIENLGVTGKIKSGWYAGGITCVAGGLSKIRNCNNKVDIVALDGYYMGEGTGGICGTARDEVIISNCYNMGYIEGTSQVGGIAGFLSGTVVVEGCYNVGKIITKGTSTYRGVGGIVGSICRDAPIITNCYNEGMVELHALSGGSYVGAGGILGKGYTYETLNITITNCYNSGIVNGGLHIAGGILGESDTNSNGNLYIEITNCYNEGQVEASFSAGGIAGFSTFSGPDRGFILHNVWNFGIVSQDSTYEGEIIGRFYDVTNSYSFDNCFYYKGNANNSVGLGSVTGELTAKDINADLITTLNQYVTTYNTTNKDNDDFIELKSWELEKNQVKFK